MKITAGFNSIEDYIQLARAGADELFCGYVPKEWYDRFPTGQPMNRREVNYCDVQIGGENDIRILADMVKDIGVPVAITLNSPYYDPVNYQFILDYIEKLLKLGYKRFIIADPGLIMFLQKRNMVQYIELHVSGEYGEYNRSVCRQIDFQGASRIIFHRHNSFDEMMRCTSGDYVNLHEFEAFFLNEKCHFMGALCSSIHCDDMPPLCKVPYRIIGRRGNGMKSVILDEQIKEDCLGAGGCALCAMWKLREAGITHLKIVGRGNHSANILSDVESARQAVRILNTSTTESEFIHLMRLILFPHGCSGNCYYP